MMWRWEAVNQWLKNDFYTPKLGAEIGVKEGRFISYMLANNPKLEMIAIDPWTEQEGASEDYKEWDFADIYTQYCKAVEPYQDRVTEFKAYSEEAAIFIKSNSLDFCFIDAQHDYESVLNDIRLWRPKVKKGGLLCGHDYNADKFPGCVKAVNESFRGMNIRQGANDVWGVWI